MRWGDWMIRMITITRMVNDTHGNSLWRTKCITPIDDDFVEMSWVVMTNDGDDNGNGTYEAI